MKLLKRLNTKTKYKIHVDATSKVRANVIRYEGKISFAEREWRNGHMAVCYWFTGLSGAGKSTLSRAFEKRLFDEGKMVFVIDGDNIRHGLNEDLGFSHEDRKENIRRVGHVARLMYDAGFIVLCSLISPMQKSRDLVRTLFPRDRFNEVFVKCSLEECIRRDPKGLYKKALAGKIPNFTGINSPYEEPRWAEYTVDTMHMNVDECVELLNSGQTGLREPKLRQSF